MDRPKLHCRDMEVQNASGAAEGPPGVLAVDHVISGQMYPGFRERPIRGSRDAATRPDRLGARRISKPCPVEQLPDPASSLCSDSCLRATRSRSAADMAAVCAGSLYINSTYFMSSASRSTARAARSSTLSLSMRPANIGTARTPAGVSQDRRTYVVTAPGRAFDSGGLDDLRHLGEAVGGPGGGMPAAPGLPHLPGGRYGNRQARGCGRGAARLAHPGDRMS